jgi:hypothetical protein
VVIIPRMSDDSRKPVDDLKEGLGLIFRAAKGAVERFPSDKLEDVAKDAAKEVSRAFESIGHEIDRAFGKPGSRSTPAPPEAPADSPPPAEAKKDEPPTAATPEGPPAKDEKRYDDGYAPEPPKGPRIG